MSKETEHFHDRMGLIQRRRRGRIAGMGFVVHPDGVVKPIGRPSSRLRFTFPLKGIVVSFVLLVAVKAYAMWALGVDIYALEVGSMLEGSSFERVAAAIAMPDALTLWVVDRYDDAYAFIQGGLAATAGAEAAAEG